MAATDYFITPNDIFRGFRWFGLRGLASLIIAGGVFAGLSYLAGYEAGFFAALLLFWTGAGYSGKVFFGVAIALLIAIMGITAADAEYEIGDTVVVEKLAVWVFYLMAIGVIKLFVEAFTHKEPSAANSEQKAAYDKPAEQAHMPTTPEVEAPTKKPHANLSVHTRPRLKQKQTLSQDVQQKTQSPRKPKARSATTSYTPTKTRKRQRPKGLIQG